MAILVFNTTINASKEKVWDVLWDDASYRKWTTVFHEGSHAVSDWQEGGSILFLGPNWDGMFSMIVKKDDFHTMIFKHLGEIKNGEKIPKQWGASTESYFMDEKDGVTTLKVELNMEAEEWFETYFNSTFPKALEVVKKLAEE